MRIRVRCRGSYQKVIRVDEGLGRQGRKLRLHLECGHSLERWRASKTTNKFPIPQHAHCKECTATVPKPRFTMKLNDTTLDYDVLDAGERRASFRREYDARMWVKRMNILAGTHAS